MVDRELLPPFAVLGWGVHRGVVADCVLPFAVEIVGHDVDEVEVPEGRKEREEVMKKCEEE